MRPTRLLGLVLAVLLLALSACTGDDGSDRASDRASDQASDSAGSGEEKPGSAPEPDLGSVPDVVAEVNGQEIAKDEFVAAYTPLFQQMTMQAQSTGQPVDQDALKKKVVDNLVNVELLAQEADARGLTPTRKQADAMLTNLARQNGMKSADQFVAALEKQGMQREDIDAQVRDQVRIDRLLADEGGDIEPTEQELRDLYRRLKDQQEKAGQQGAQKIPPFAEVKPQLEEQLRSQQESAVASALLEGLRKDADIQIHL